MEGAILKKICVFTLYDEKGASSQYRAFIFKDVIEQHFKTLWYPFWNNKYVTKYMYNKKKYVFNILCLYLVAILKRVYQLLFIAPKADVIFIQKAVIPKLPFLLFGRAKKQNVRIIFDVDDAVWLSDYDNSDNIAKNSNVVICGNETLFNHYVKFNKHCCILPTVERTFLFEKYWKNTFEDKVIGWIGSKTTVSNLKQIVRPINRIVEKYPIVKFHIISNDALDYTSRIKNSDLIKWNKDTYIQELAKFTVGIMPLIDNEFNQGKCGFKLVQCLSMKKPVVGSDIGVNAKIIGNNGFIVNNEDEWEAALEKLLFNKNIYDKCVQNIECEFIEKYHFRNISNKLIDIIDGNNMYEVK